MSSTIKKDTQPDSRVIKKNGAILIGSMIMTFALFRLYLQIAPDTDLNVGHYNIHHLFTGLLLIAAGGTPLAVFHSSTRRLGLALITFGIGLGMALDEWVYLIATDGSNASYLLPVSFWGGAIVIFLACVYTFVLMKMKGRNT
jgi:hypothetical protein